MWFHAVIMPLNMIKVIIPQHQPPEHWQQEISKYLFSVIFDNSD